MEHEIDRLDKYLKTKGINDNEFTNTTGISNGWIGKTRENKSSITDKTRSKILKAYPDLSEAYLKVGIEPMLMSDIKIKKITGDQLKMGIPAEILLEMSEAEKEFWKQKYLDLLNSGKQ